MNEEMRKEVERITVDWANRGKVVQGGWLAYEFLTGIRNMSEVQRRECRRAFFSGAQHLFASILTILEPGAEPTQADLGRMDKINAELEEFMEELKRGGSSGIASPTKPPGT